MSQLFCCFFFFNDPATTEIYTLSLHDALPILRIRTPRERPVDARCVPPQACRSSPTISTTRTLPSDAGGGATERQRISPGSLARASAATQETRSGRSWRMTSLSCGSSARSRSLSTSGRSKAVRAVPSSFSWAPVMSAPVVRDLKAGDPRLARVPREAAAIGELAAAPGMKRALLQHDGAGPRVEDARLDGQDVGMVMAEVARHVSTPIVASSLLRGEKVIVRRVVDASRRPSRGLRATGLRRQAAHGIYALYARDLADRAFRPDGRRGKQQPRDGVGHWGVGTFLHRTQDLAAIVRFPMWAGIVSADPVSTRVEKIGFGSHERPFVSPGLILSGTAFVDLHALCGNDHRQRFARPGFELIRHPDHRRRRLRARACGDEERQQESPDVGCLGNDPSPWA